MKRGAPFVATLGILVVSWVQQLGVRPTNFGGWDEWLVIDLTSRGILGLPYQNRPFSLVFTQPGALALPGSLRGYWLAHGLYLSLAGVLLHRLCRRLAPGRERLALLAGALAVSWAPLDDIRLDTVLVASYAGFTFATLLAMVLLVESALARHRGGLAVAAALAFLLVRGLEATAGLVLAAPALLWLVPGVERRTRAAWSLAWLSGALAAAALVGAPLLGGGAASYQVSGLGFDPHPFRVAGRLLGQLGFHLGPLLAPRAGELLAPGVPAAALALGGAWLLLGRSAPGDEAGPGGGAWRLAAVGLSLAVLASSVMALSPSAVVPARMQILSAPGIGLFLAAVMVGLGELGGPRVRHLPLVLGAAVVAMGAGRTAALQQAWDAKSYWAAQDRGLFGLTRAAPQLERSSFVLLLDDAGAWPASFTFQHALRYLYGGRADGSVWGAEPFLYPTRLVAEGVLFTPYESIRGPWRVPARLYRYDEVVVVRQSRDGRVSVLDAWPAALPPLPSGAGYAPRARIRSQDPPPPEHGLLVGPSEGGGLR